MHNVMKIALKKDREKEKENRNKIRISKRHTNIFACNIWVSR